MTETLLQQLEIHPFVADLRPEHRGRLAALAKRVHFDPDQIIFHEGDDYSVLYLLEKGMVALELDVPDQRYSRIRPSTSRPAHSTTLLRSPSRAMTCTPASRRIRRSVSLSCCA